MSNVRIFGSVATGADDSDSDVDLLATIAEDASLFDIARPEAALSQLLEEQVDVVPDRSLHHHVVNRVLGGAVPL